MKEPFVFLILLISLWTIMLQQQQQHFIATASSSSSPFSDFQISDEYPPNKTSTWTYGIELDGWMLAHDALRGEVADIEKALETICGLTTNTVGGGTLSGIDSTTTTKSSSLSSSNLLSKQQVNALYKIWKYHNIHMKSHHRNEDDMIKKFVSKRFHYPEFMELDHHNILEEHLKIITNIIQQIVHISKEEEYNNRKKNKKKNKESTTTTTKSQIQQQKLLLMDLWKSWRKYTVDLRHHLIKEEVVGIGLLRAYFLPSEVSALTTKLSRSGPRVETGSIVHYVGHNKMKQSMRAQQVPKLLEMIAWIFILKPRYRFYKAKVLRPLSILMESSTTTTTTANDG